ncbi:MAG: gluconate 2-dehydrogenase subunit 3 family protein [bacterium]|nr:hypothetical protein [Deltaproteobacteria bacterium]MCP4904824.1 gluconate 2-dehydrogenase subunit 3 family protein [bacterium]
MNRKPGSDRGAENGVGKSASEWSRRELLVGGAGLWISMTLPRTRAVAEAAASDEPALLSQREWRVVEAMTGRILPTDDTPGAIEAGCVNFIDKALAGEDGAAAPGYRSALAELERLCRGRFDSSFADLSAEHQDRVLAELETATIEGWSAADAAPDAFFATLRMHTILGFTLDPKYGGNRDYVGWKTMGFPGPVHQLGGARPEQMSGEKPFVPIWARSSGSD